MPVVSQKLLDGNVGEKVIIYFNWFMHCQVDPFYKSWYEETKKRSLGGDKRFGERLTRILQCGKLQYLWSKNHDVVSCVNIHAVWGLEDRLVFETCHPELRVLTLEEARENTLRYFKNPKEFDRNEDLYA